MANKEPAHEYRETQLLPPARYAEYEETRDDGTTEIVRYPIAHDTRTLVEACHVDAHAVPELVASLDEDTAEKIAREITARLGDYPRVMHIHTTPATAEHHLAHPFVSFIESGVLPYIRREINHLLLLEQFVIHGDRTPDAHQAQHLAYLAVLGVMRDKSATAIAAMATLVGEPPVSTSPAIDTGWAPPEGRRNQAWQPIAARES